MTVKATLRNFHLALCALLTYQLVTVGQSLNFSPAILRSTFAPDAAARESLPANVIEASGLIRKHALQEFSLSPALSADHLFTQRIVEYSYPVRLKAAASAMLAKADEIEAAHCRLIDRGDLIAVCAAP